MALPKRTALRAPSRTAALTAGLAPAQLPATLNHGEWSANDVLAHLRVCADMWGSCIEVIITQDKPTIQAVNPRTWINDTDYLELEFRLSLRSFATQCTDLLKVLEPLAPKGRSRTATVTGAGKPLVRTVHTYAQRLARHERTHLKQIDRIVSTMRL